MYRGGVYTGCDHGKGTQVILEPILANARVPIWIIAGRRSDKSVFLSPNKITMKTLTIRITIEMTITSDSGINERMLSQKGNTLGKDQSGNLDDRRMQRHQNCFILIAQNTNIKLLHKIPMLNCCSK